VTILLAATMTYPEDGHQDVPAGQLSLTAIGVWVGMVMS
jgi:hypothetical protein